MVSGKVKSVMGFQRTSSPAPSTPRRSSSSPAMSSNSSAGKSSSLAGKSGGASSFARSIGVYFPSKSSAQVQPKPPDPADLLRAIEELQERESRLRTQLLEMKILRETVQIVPALEAELEREKERANRLERENEGLRGEIEGLKEKEREIEGLKKEIISLKLKKTNHDECCSSCSSSSSTSSSGSSLSSSGRFKEQSGNGSQIINGESTHEDKSQTKSDKTNQESHRPATSSAGSTVPPPPPLPTYSFAKSYRPATSSSSTSSSSSSTSSSPSEPSRTSKPSLTSLPPIPPPEPSRSSSSSGAPPPPPPPPPARGGKGGRNLQEGSRSVKREPEVVEFYHALMRRDSKREGGGGAATGDLAPAICPRDMIGEIENRSAHLLAIKSDIETQGDFIKFLIKEVQNALFTKIDDVVTFVKWLDDELSCLVDERAVLKHFDWPEQKADALREAAFGFSDLKKLENEASCFKDDSRQPCGIALKKMQTLFEKLEHGAYSLARMRDGAMSRYKGFRIPWDWMQDSGIPTQIKLASVKLAKLYMKRVSSELEALMGGPDEEELMLQAIRFAFRVHQFAGGFDLETMRAFQELKEKVSTFHIQNQNQQRLVGKN